MRGKNAFPFPMSKTEAIVGWVYVFVHTFALSVLVELLGIYVFPLLHIPVTPANVNFAYYAFSFIFLLIFLFKFWRDSFRILWSNVLQTLGTIVISYFVYLALGYLVTLLLDLFLDDLVNPNSAAVSTVMKLNPNTMIAIAVLLAPVVEETLFRGVVFGTIRKKSRIAAYLVSTLFFAVYHLWSYLLDGFSWQIVLYLVQYIPAGIVLAWCYERSENLWGSVFLHMIINYVSVTVTLGV